MKAIFFRNFIILLIHTLASHDSQAQYKIVKIPSEDIYIRYFDFKNISEEYKNDSTYFVCIKGNKDTVQILKLINNSISYAYLYKLKLAASPMNISTRTTGASQIKQKKAEYYIAEMIRQIW